VANGEQTALSTRSVVLLNHHINFFKEGIAYCN